MKNQKIWILCWLGCLLLSSFSAKAAIELRSERLTTADGLANNSVRYIYQDSKGFIWMATLNGLNRYDGNSLITFRPQKSKKISLADIIPALFNADRMKEGLPHICIFILHIFCLCQN